MLVKLGRETGICRWCECIAKLRVIVELLWSVIVECYCGVLVHCIYDL